MKYKKIIILVIILIIALTSCVLASDLTNGITINKTKAKEAEGIGNVIFGIVRVIASYAGRETSHCATSFINST